VSGLGHYLEQEGLATTQISLIRLHTEKIKPPRALWVPFELGRPLGAANDAVFQRRVLLAVLGLLEAEHGPVLVDFPEEAPAAEASDMEGWVCPIKLAPPPKPESADGQLAEAMADEMARLQPWFDLAVETRGRSSLGLSGVELETARAFLLSFLGAEPAQNPLPALKPAEALRLVYDDLKAFYVDAATAQPGKASGREMQEWLWGETSFGKILFALRAKLLAAEDKDLRLAGKWFLVPSSLWDRAP
jgi:hypothetical protein